MAVRTGWSRQHWEASRLAGTLKQEVLRAFSVPLLPSLTPSLAACSTGTVHADCGYTLPPPQDCALRQELYRFYHYAAITQHIGSSDKM